ncbi:MAG TPA: Asp-tRNA(Asn)/Glu-tRNA(Gln) amidotransferase subunit GatB [Candidatus Krumholzibacteria bacterium]|nr:Asp-tRNA(Asn)/Glu-tRNA(Gln) amidotransferase subunit GatB [Candidatus Krumholzibacteria bacterium]
MSTRYEAVIGLEVHAQLSTNSKMFCGCSAAYGGAPNTQVCPVCLGLPGALPVVNARAIEFAVRLGLATGCRIANQSVFARKNYFYPDCPKDYQISQFDTPLCSDGHVDIEGGARTVRVKRIHVEEDAGKLVHVDGADHSLVDMNRSGVPLVEIVSEPDIRSGREASEYLQKLRSLVRYLEICDGNMEEGSLRCDVNLSVRPVGNAEFGVKTEVKNLNSFKQVEQAIEFELERQSKVLESGGRVTHDTLLWDAAKGRATVMRTKEEAHDYRYFPEPDLRVLRVSDATIARVGGSLPELPDARQARFVSRYKLPAYDAALLTTARDIADYYEDVVKAGADPKAASNWVMGEVMRELNERAIEIRDFTIGAKNLAELVMLQASGRINSSTAKDVFKQMLAGGARAADIVAKGGLEQVSDTSAIEGDAKAVLDENPDEVARYLAGKEQLLQFFVGQLMKRTRGKANPKLATELIRGLLDARRKG